MAENPMDKLVLLTKEQVWGLVPKGYKFPEKSTDAKRSPKQPDPKSSPKARPKLSSNEEQYHFYSCNNISCRNDWLVVSRGQSMPCRDCRNEVPPWIDHYFTPHTRAVRAWYKCKRCQEKWHQRRVTPNQQEMCPRANCDNADRVSPYRQLALPN